jgi:hypothetical protein
MTAVCPVVCFGVCPRWGRGSSYLCIWRRRVIIVYQWFRLVYSGDLLAILGVAIYVVVVGLFFLRGETWEQSCIALRCRKT